MDAKLIHAATAEWPNHVKHTGPEWFTDTLGHVHGFDEGNLADKPGMQLLTLVFFHTLGHNCF
jgi:hypothetical protein